MIERLLVAQRALADGELDQAERLFAQVVEADARNAMAVVGLAEVALARGDASDARTLATRALAIDPEDAAAARLAAGPAPAAAAAETASVPAPAVAPGPVAAPAGLARLRSWLWRLVGRSN
jgi:thioredoxin-like negative regulator of GroEL